MHTQTDRKRQLIECRIMVGGWKLPQLALVHDLLLEPLPVGSNILVEYDASSQWYNAALMMAAGWLRTGGRVSYSAVAQSPASVRSKLQRLGLDVKRLENLDYDGLRIWDWYSAAHGKKSTERLRIDSLKVADLSIMTNRDMKSEDSRPDPNRLTVKEDFSCLSRFNDEKLFLEYVLTRDFQENTQCEVTALTGFMSGIHSDSFYRRLEAEVDGVLDFKIEERDGEVVNLVRVRVMRNAAFDSTWHPFRVGENFKVTLAE
jgi:KaiC/GvpD/RAD55 family RecA-like ATPase